MLRLSVFHSLECCSVIGAAGRAGVWRAFVDLLSVFCFTFMKRCVWYRAQLCLQIKPHYFLSEKICPTDTENHKVTPNIRPVLIMFTSFIRLWGWPIFIYLKRLKYIPIFLAAYRNNPTWYWMASAFIEQCRWIQQPYLIYTVIHTEAQGAPGGIHLDLLLSVLSNADCDLCYLS